MARLEDGSGRSFPLSGPVVKVGRDPTNDIVLDDDRQVSRRHAELRLRGDQWVLTDLNSRNGTRVNDRAVRLLPLVDGDRLQVGRATFAFIAGDDPNATEADLVREVHATGLLSEREREVVALVALGLADKEIGERLHISTSTVRSHLDRIANKTALRRRTELRRLAEELGLVP